MKTRSQGRLVGISILVVIVGLSLLTYYSFRATSPNASPLLISPLSLPQSASPLTQALVLPTPIQEDSTPDDPGVIVTAAPFPEPVYTEIPFPTPYPTPVVTPISTIAPPYLEGLEALPPQPFWMYWSEGDEVWRVDNEGNDPELVLDTFAATGSHLLGDAPEGQGSDCCISTHYLAIAPDQQKIALVTIDQEKIDTELGKFPYGSAVAIHVYDMQLGSSIPIGSGTLPVWSPDSKQVAFLRDGALWVANLATGEISERVQARPSEEIRVAEYAWSPDSTQLAFVNVISQYQRISTIWNVNLASDEPPTVIFNPDEQNKNLAFYGLQWSSDQQSIYFLSNDQAQEFIQNSDVLDLWKVSVVDGAAQAITEEMYVGSFGFLREQGWLFLTARQLYEPLSDEYGYSHLWLFNENDNTLQRLTAGAVYQGAFGSTPDGNHLLMTDENRQPQLFSLFDGSITSLDERIGENYYFGGAK